MTEWIVAPLLAADPTSRPVYRPDGNDNQAAGDNTGQAESERRGGERREPHTDTDDDFGRGEDRRGDAA